MSPLELMVRRIKLHMFDVYTHPSTHEPNYMLHVQMIVTACILFVYNIDK